MIKCILKCQKCQQKTNAYDTGDSILEIDFIKKSLSFLCPKCGYENIMDFNIIEKKLNEKSRLPKIGGAK